MTAFDLTSVDFRDFVAGEDEPYHWAIPGLLEHGDRLILTGNEGKGKSTLLRQIAVLAACGLHPFTLDAIDPITVWSIDLENQTRHLKREFKKFFRDMQPDNLIISSLPAGIDLHADNERAAMAAKLKAIKPDLVIIGPMYKMTSASLEHGDEGSKELSMVLDLWRDAFDFALILESHQPHASIGQDDDKKSKFMRPERPVGSSLWLRWPEFGFCLEDGGVLRPWRGKRDQDREWPEKLFRGGGFPFTVIPSGCLVCGKSLTGRQERFCSDRCSVVHRKRDQRARERQGEFVTDNP